MVSRRSFVNILCAKFQQKNIKLQGSWSLSKFSNFETKYMLCWKLFKFCMKFCITQLVLSNYGKFSLWKNNFILTTQATLITQKQISFTWNLCFLKMQFFIFRSSLSLNVILKSLLLFYFGRKVLESIYC